ncbi:uncharacterized protein LOC115629993 [Scaptodrosophila lebanonensis]|uniref:Uncharacterized protein LOC115629993 n=1 Tax=Drosophila lebanonensis TaxID=7225 RepID=A0A6J2U274_DROLE|nr:uncharacterized protein LOC115629993 [Scaptodrosophila lebanonensis]
MLFVEKFLQIRNFVVNVCLIETIQFVEDITRAICLDISGFVNQKS